MSYSHPIDARQVFARSAEFDDRVAAEIRPTGECPESKANTAKLYMSRRRRAGRFQMYGLNHIRLLDWRKEKDSVFMKSCRGYLTMEDVRCMAQGIEEDENIHLDYLTKGGLQYAVVRTVQSIGQLRRVNVGIFGLNPFGMDDTDRTQLKTRSELVEIHRLVAATCLETPNIFTKDFILFPILRANEAACIVIVNPSALLAKNEGPKRGKCQYIEIGTNAAGNGELKKDINTIVDTYRNLHEQGAFRGRPRTSGLDMVPYDVNRFVHVPRLPVDGDYEQQFQLLFIIQKLLENGSRIEDFMAHQVKDLGKDRYEMLRAVKLLRLMLLDDMAFDIHKDGTEYQRYLYERRMEELGEQEKERNEELADGSRTERRLRREYDLRFPPSNVINVYPTITV